MLSKELRLKKASDFAYIAKKGSVINTSIFNIRYIFTNSREKKIGIVINTKVSKKSTVRNRIKRQIRVISYRYLNILPEGIKLFIQIKPEIITKNIVFSDKERYILGLFSEINEKNK